MGYISDIRKLIGHSPIMMTAAMCILYDREKGLLLEKRSDDGTWCVPGGGLELGETLEQALRREVREETSLEIEDPCFLMCRRGYTWYIPTGTRYITRMWCTSWKNIPGRRSLTGRARN